MKRIRPDGTGKFLQIGACARPCKLCVCDCKPVFQIQSIRMSLAFHRRAEGLEGLHVALPESQVARLLYMQAFASDFLSSRRISNWICHGERDKSPEMYGG